MDAPRGSLLNRLLRELPAGYVADTEWLGDRGISASSVRDYVARGWLERLAPRLYGRDAAKAGEGVRWEATLLSLQNLLGEPIHVGGLTALELAGYWQYAVLGRRQVWLYSDSRRARSILQRLPMTGDAVLRSRKLFLEPELGVEKRPFDPVTATLRSTAASGDGASTHPQMLHVSSLERGILEVLDEVPGAVGFEHAAELFEGLTTLRPKLAVALLESCRSVKAKRLFMYLAGQHGYAWGRAIKRAAIDLGSGKRQIVVGGKLDPEYNITVPADRHPGRSGSAP